MIQGIDVSSHNGRPDFAKAHAAGFAFAICKATEGQGFTDPRFLENWAKLGDVPGMKRGAYHFARPDSVGGRRDGEAEARDFCAVLKRAGSYGCGAMPPALDFEKYSDSDGDDNIPWIAGFVAVVEAELGRSPMIYTGRNVWRYETGNTNAFAHLPLWQVSYSRTARRPMRGLPWPAWTLWQWSGGGRFAHSEPVPGVGVADVNRFNGDAASLERLASPAIWTRDNPWRVR